VKNKSEGESMTTELMEPEKKSTHKVEIVPFQMEKHPDADSLSIVNVFGYTCVVRTEDWKGIELAAYLPPDSVVDVTRPEFTFLLPTSKDGRTARIKAKRLRGIQSFGCLVPAPADCAIGDDVAERLGVTHYDPPIKGEGGSPKERLFTGGDVAKAPDVFTVKYDVDALRRYHHLFEKEELVVVTEKLDGANSRYVFHDGKMHCGSRTEWKKEYPDYSHVTRESLTAGGVPDDRIEMILDKLHNQPKKRNMWWEILDRTPTLRTFCEKHPNHIIYGEAFGNVGRIKYGVPDGFAAFDIMINGKWLDGSVVRQLMADNGVPQVPLLGLMLYDFDTICKLADGDTLIEGPDPRPIREGVVVKPVRERRDRHIGRVQLKCVSADYLARY
jgi:RNA ligase (TIGR02306 family)